MEMEMSDIVTGAPLLLKMTVCAELVVFSCCELNTRLLGETVSWGPPTPVPLRPTR